MLVEEREPAVSSKLQPDTQLLEEPGIVRVGHLINVMPESEVYRFWNGGLLTSTERVTVPVVFADHPLLLSNSVVESPVLSLLIGRDVVGGLGLDIKGSNRTLEYNGRSQPLEDSVAGHYCMTLSPERYARLLKLESSPDPPTSRLRPRPTSLVPRNSRSKLASTLEICLSLQQQHLWTAQVCDKRVVLQTARDTSWHVTDWASGSTVPSHAKKDFHQLARRSGTVHGLWPITAFIHLVCDLVCG